MRKTSIYFVIGAAVLLGCSNREGTPRTLKSGNEIGLRYAGVVHNSYSVEYCSALPLGDRRSLGGEADQVFDALRAEIAQSRVSEGSLWPTVCQWQVRWAGWTPVIIREESTDFAYSLSSVDGAWTRRN